ncbi:MAG: hypothetical protein U9Q15_05190 [Patescibacteria group bacterium]|nr:hypothetical protein [Patescibacteria group bacterium]
MGTITNYLPMLEVEAKKKPVGMGDPVIVAQYTHELTELMIEMASLNNE